MGKHTAQTLVCVFHYDHCVLESGGCDPYLALFDCFLKSGLVFACRSIIAM